METVEARQGPQAAADPHLHEADCTAAITAVRLGDYDGGLLILPEAGLAVDLSDGDVVALKTHEVWHGVTPVVPRSPGAARVSCVAFTKQEISTGCPWCSDPQPPSRAGGGPAITTTGGQARG